MFVLEEIEDEKLMVMEYVEGKKLPELIRVEGYLSIELNVKYTSQITEGIRLAHAKGVVYRDIKSANMMILDKGQVKIMDFGLAKKGADHQLVKAESTLGIIA